MDVFTFAFLCTLIGCSIPLSKIWLNRQRGVDDAELEAVRAELEQMRARLAALETIVTDGRYDLERELQRLEDAS